MVNASAIAFNALGDPTRRLIFEKLRGKKLAVSEITAGLLVSRPAVSQHLKVLKEAKLIEMYKKGTKSICQINDEGVSAMRSYLDQFWSEALASFKQVAEDLEKTTKI
jgi:DNA-binding transcriptional ArsR family regulator